MKIYIKNSTSISQIDEIFMSVKMGSFFYSNDVKDSFIIKGINFNMGDESAILGFYETEDRAKEIINDFSLALQKAIDNGARDMLYIMPEE